MGLVPDQIYNADESGLFWKEVQSSRYYFTDGTTVVNYVPKKNKNVVLMSTLHHDNKISNRQDCKPIMILDYNDRTSKRTSGRTHFSMLAFEMFRYYQEDVDKTVRISIKKTGYMLCKFQPNSSSWSKVIKEGGIL
jgi:hypothetical protein